MRRSISRRRFLAASAGIAGAVALRCRGSGDGPRASETSRAANTPAGKRRSIAEENALPGDEAWRITDHPALAGEIAAYCSRTSVAPGETLDVFVSASAANARADAEIYRMGWYGGAGGRNLRSLRNIEVERQGWWTAAAGLRDCGSCRLESATLLTECNWRRTFQLKIPFDWVSGYYLIRLHERSSDTHTYAIFVVRDDDSPAPIAVQASTNTWQAYNIWGDASLYGSFGADRQYVGKTRRAYRVSYDRPYDPMINNKPGYGAGEFFRWEYNFVRWAERQGYDMTYLTNVDVHLRGDRLLRRRLFVSVGHDEYWTKQQRDAVEGARDAGVNIAFLSGNEAYWQSRLDPSAAGASSRVLTCYKDASLDPLARERPTETTVLFADPPVNRPQSMLSGLGYGSNTQPDYIAWRPVSTDEWIFAGTGIKPGDAFPGIVGYEYDHMAPADQRPDGLVVVGRSPVNGFLGEDTSISAYYTAPSGATVFAAGTIAWAWGLDDFGHEDTGAFADRRLQRLTANIIERLSQPRTVPAPG
jgi:hypothetical protein